MKWRYLLMVMAVVGPLLVLSCRDEVRTQPVFDKLTTEVVAGDPPDIVYMDSLRAPRYIFDKTLTPVPDKLDLKDFYPQLLRYFQRDGNTYAVPHDFQTVELAVNAKIFADVGLPLPDDDFTWKDLEDDCRRLTEKGYLGIGLTATMVNWLPFVYQAGGSLLDETGTKMTLQSDAAVEALTWYAGLVQNKLAVAPESGSWPSMGYDQLLSMFVDGKLGMIMVGPSPYNLLVAQFAERKMEPPPIRVVPLPRHPATGRRTTVAYVVGYAFAREPTAASLDFLTYAVSPEGMQIWYNPAALNLKPPAPPPVMFVPARMSLAEDWLKANSSDDAAASAAAAFLGGVEDMGFYQPATLSYGAMQRFDEQADKILAEVLAGDLDPRPAVDRIGGLGAELLAANQ